MPHLGALFGHPIRVKIPAEFADKTALLSYLGVGAPELKKIWFYRWKMYSHFSISKSPNKVRWISAPDKRLKYIQRKIADKLKELYRPRNPVHGFVSGRSIKTNASSHLRRRFVINVDLKDFFPTITQKRVMGMLLSLGFDDQVAKIISHICCNDGHLPQGAPSSPLLSNIICFRLDKQLMELAKEARCIYTRYADDITFSSHQPPTVLFDGSLPLAGRFPPELLAPRLRNIIQQNGFTINADKAHYADRHSRRCVTGIKVNEILNVDRPYVRNIRAALHSVETLGLKDAQKKYHDKHGGAGSLAAHIRGKISFLAHIKGLSDPVVRNLTVRFNRNFPAHPIEVMPTPEETRDRAVWVVEHSLGTDDGMQGTAFFLKGKGLITAAHCVKGIREVEVFHPSKHSNTFTASVLRFDPDRDLAILSHSIPETEFFELDLAAKEIARGDPVTAAGYPDWAPGDHLNVRPGFVSTLTVKSAVQLIEIGHKVSQGMSGGPLLDADDKVVGIIHKGGPDEGRDFAVHAKVLTDWLGEY